MEDISRLKKLSGEKLIQKINRIPDDLMYFAANLDQSKDSHDILESVAKSLEAAAAKIRS